MRQKKGEGRKAQRPVDCRENTRLPPRSTVFKAAVVATHTTENNCCHKRCPCSLPPLFHPGELSQGNEFRIGRKIKRRLCKDDSSHIVYNSRNLETTGMSNNRGNALANYSVPTG